MSKKLTLLATCALFAIAPFAFAQDDNAAKPADEAMQSSEEQKSSESMEGAEGTKDEHGSDAAAGGSK